MRRFGLLIITTIMCCIPGMQPTMAQSPVNPNASAEAQSLLQYLYDMKGQGIITGEHNEQYDPVGWDNDLKAKNGNVEPGLWGNDFRYGSNVQYRQNWINEAKNQWNNKGKIITIMYHQVRPMDSETSGWSSVQGELSYSEFEGLLTDGNWIHEKWEDKMDDIAYYLQQLEDDDIPVLFRPYHEMNGSWFWWGGKSSNNQFIRLWQMTYDYLTNEKGLNNLIWVLNFDDTNNDLSSYYPGNQYVDALATDIYNANFSTSHYNALQNLANGKPIAIGEVGDMISMNTIKSTYSDYVWLMGWRSLFVDNNSSSTLYNIFHDDYAINASDLPDLSNYSGSAPNPVSIPAKIEAEDYTAMNGIQTEPTSDSGGGENVGWFDPGNWLEYLIDVPSSGQYDLALRVASPNSGARIQISEGSNTLSTVDVPNTGDWQPWTTISTTVSLSSGEQTIRLTSVDNNSNINWIDFSTSSGGSGNGTYSARVEIDPYDANGWDNFTARVINNSNSTSDIASVDISLNGAEIDFIDDGSQFTAAPNGGGHNNGTYTSSTTLSFSNGLSAGSSDDNGQNSDLDNGSLTGGSVTINFEDGGTLSGSLVNEGDSDDSDAQLWVFEDESGASSNARVEIDPYDANGWDNFTARVINSSGSSADITSVDISINGADIDYINDGNQFSASPNGGGHNNSTFISSTTLSFSSNLTPGSSDDNGQNSDLDNGSVTGGTVTVYFSDGSQVSGSLTNEGDSDDGDAQLWVFDSEGSTGSRKAGTEDAERSSLKSSELNVYPNPFNDRLKVNLNSLVNGDYNMMIYSQTGRKIFEKHISKNDMSPENITIDVSHLKQGLFFMKIADKTGDKNVLTRKLIKIY